MLPSITFDIKRDREEEMIHRGVQYSRAIRAYYKKFGRYPTKIEDLENTNNLRFLRKRYKDPMNCKNQVRGFQAAALRRSEDVVSGGMAERFRAPTPVGVADGSKRTERVGWCRAALRHSAASMGPIARRRQSRAGNESQTTRGNEQQSRTHPAPRNDQRIDDAGGR